MAFAGIAGAQPLKPIAPVVAILEAHVLHTINDRRPELRPSPRALAATPSSFPVRSKTAVKVHSESDSDAEDHVASAFDETA